jgi:hypothetical protein
MPQRFKPLTRKPCSAQNKLQIRFLGVQSWSVVENSVPATNTFTLRAGSKDRDCLKSDEVFLSIRDCDRNDALLQEHGASLIGRIGAPGFKLLSDFYHMQIEEKGINEILTELAT